MPRDWFPTVGGNGRGLLWGTASPTSRRGCSPHFQFLFQKVDADGLSVHPLKAVISKALADGGLSDRAVAHQREFAHRSFGHVTPEAGFPTPGSHPLPRSMLRLTSKFTPLSRSLVRGFSAETAAATPAGGKLEELHLNFAVASRTLVKNRVVTRVTLPGRGGTFGVEKNMPPTVAELRPGVVLVEYEKGEKEEFFVPVRGPWCAGAGRGAWWQARRVRGGDVSAPPLAPNQCRCRCRRGCAAACVATGTSQSPLAVLPRA